MGAFMQPHIKKPNRSVLRTAAMSVPRSKLSADVQQVRFQLSYNEAKHPLLIYLSLGSGCQHDDDHVWTKSPANPDDVAAFQARQAQAATIAGVCQGPKARVWGDPHFVTFDNLKYDCQGQGEFVIATTKV